MQLYRICPQHGHCVIFKVTSKKRIERCFFSPKLLFSYFRGFRPVFSFFFQFFGATSLLSAGNDLTFFYRLPCFTLRAGFIFFPVSSVGQDEPVSDHWLLIFFVCGIRQFSWYDIGYRGFISGPR